jgi:hypothetical protein
MRRFDLLALVALLLVGCSSAGPASTLVPAAVPTPTAPPTPTTPPTPIPSPTLDPRLGQIRAAVLATIGAKTVGLDESATYVGNVAIKNGTAIRGSGTVSFGVRRQLVMTADYSALSLGKLRMILDDQNLYLYGTLLRAVVPSGKWLLVSLSSNDRRALPFLQITKGQNDSSLLLYALFGAVPPIDYLGDEELDGVATSHYRFGLDLETAPDVAPPSAREHLLDAIAALRAAEIDRRIDGQAWVGTDGYIHKVSYTYTLGRLSGGGTLEVVCTFRDFGKPLDLGLPKASTIVRLEDLKP